MLETPIVHAPTPVSIPSSDGALAPGTRLGRYELVRRLAVGGMAELYLARHAGLGGFQKLVALKRILPQYAQSSDFVAMFLDEARLAATIQHANVAQVYDLGRTEHGLYFTMEYVHGEDVRAIVNAAIRRREEVPLGVAVGIAIGAAGGLHAAHELCDEAGTLVGLVHRDVSPSNVLVSYGGCVKLIDFGVAKAAGRQQETRAGTLKGKIAYMSPEQCAGGAIDRRSDVFALGVVLYEMTTGTRLFSSEGGDYALMKRIVEEDAPRPSARRPGYPEELEQIVLRALCRDPAGRYASAQALGLDLERFARRRRLATSMTDLAAYLRELFPERGGEPSGAGGVGRAVRMATGTPHREVSRSHPRFGAEGEARGAGVGAGAGGRGARDGHGGDGDGDGDGDEPAIEVVAMSTAMFAPTALAKSAPGLGAKAGEGAAEASAGSAGSAGSAVSAVSAADIALAVRAGHRRGVVIAAAASAVAAAIAAVIAVAVMRPGAAAGAGERAASGAGDRAASGAGAAPALERAASGAGDRAASGAADRVAGGALTPSPASGAATVAGGSGADVAIGGGEATSGAASGAATSHAVPAAVPVPVPVAVPVVAPSAPAVARPSAAAPSGRGGSRRTVARPAPARPAPAKRTAPASTWDPDSALPPP